MDAGAASGWAHSRVGAVLWEVREPGRHESGSDPRPTRAMGLMSHPPPGRSGPGTGGSARLVEPVDTTVPGLDQKSLSPESRQRDQTLPVTSGRLSRVPQSLSRVPQSLSRTFRACRWRCPAGNRQVSWHMSGCQAGMVVNRHLAWHTGAWRGLICRGEWRFVERVLEPCLATRETWRFRWSRISPARTTAATRMRMAAVVEIRPGSYRSAPHELAQTQPCFIEPVSRNRTCQLWASRRSCGVCRPLAVLLARSK